MTETLLSPSNILLFGRKLADLVIRPPGGEPKKVRLASSVAIASPPTGHEEVDGFKVKQGDIVLLTAQANTGENKLWQVQAAQAAWTAAAEQPEVNGLVRVKKGDDNKGLWVRESNLNYKKIGRGGKKKLGQNSFLEQQLDLEDAVFARIYGFSFEGTYFELARPTLFLVHGEGELATGALPSPASARGPLDPSITGLAAAEFQFADQLKVWSYDSADYSIRMDVETGTLQQLLIGPYFDDGHGVSGAKISGAKVSGAKVSGAKVSGAKLSGSRLSGWRGDAGD